MKRLPIVLILLATCRLASAQILISNFSDLADQAYTPFNSSWNGGTGSVDQFVQNSGYVSITPVDGGNPDGMGSFDAAFPGSDLNNPSSVNFGSITVLQLTARLDAGNNSGSFTVVISDENDVEIGQATFFASSFGSSFSAVNATFDLTGGGDATQATYWTLGGDAVRGDNVRASFDNLTAYTSAPATVPEPSTYALLGLGLVALYSCRRKRSAARH